VIFLARLRSRLIDGEGALARQLCRACLARGKVEPATCADHITPHAGNANAFFLSPLQSLCHACHALKTARETRGYSKQIRLDGLPVDPAHPVYGRQNGTSTKSPT